MNESDIWGAQKLHRVMDWLSLETNVKKKEKRTQDLGEKGAKKDKIK